VADFEFDTGVRWARFDPGRTLARRPDAELPFVKAVRAGPALLLDTTVYIDQLQGRLPDMAAGFIEIRQVNHSAVAIQELMHTVGRLDPVHSGTSEAIHQIGRLIKAMPAHRVFAADPDTLGRAALLSGILCRLQGYAKDEKLRALMDSILFLQARRLGFAVLTRNIRDYDYFLQLFPAARILLYRTEPA